jgi:hypothetical protein
MRSVLFLVARLVVSSKAGWRRAREAAEAAERHAKEERQKQEAVEAARQEAAYAAENPKQYAALKGYKLSLREAAQAISVTGGTLQQYIKSGRLRVNPDGTIKAVELLRAGFIVRTVPLPDESSAHRGR